MRRRNFLRLAAGTVALPALARIVRADTYPSRPVHLADETEKWHKVIRFAGIKAE